MRRLALHVLSALALAAASLPASAYTLSDTYYEDTASSAGVCPDGYQCTISLPLPAALTGKLLTIEWIDCSGQTGAGPISNVSYFVNDGSSASNRRYHGLSFERTPGSNVFSWNKPVKFKITGGPPRVFNIGFTGPNTWWSITCGIVGTISNQ